MAKTYMNERTRTLNVKGGHVAVRIVATYDDIEVRDSHDRVITDHLGVTAQCHEGPVMARLLYVDRLWTMGEADFITLVNGSRWLRDTMWTFPKGAKDV